MLTRSLLLLGLCAALGVATPSIAATAKPENTATQAAKPKAKATAEKPAKLKKKVAKADKTKKSAKDKDLTDAEQAAAKKLEEKEKAKAKQLAAEKQREAKKLAMRAKAKADADARREAALAGRNKSKQVELVSTEKPTKKVATIVGPDKPINGLTAERIAAQQAAAVGADVVVREGNNGELRSGQGGVRPSGGFFEILFGDEPTTVSSAGMLPETRALDSVLETKKKFKPKSEYEPQRVAFSGYPRGTIVIDTANHFLYLVESGSSARRYGIAVGREGLQFKGSVVVGDKQEWPRWIPTIEMQQREPKKYGQYKDGMPGGGENPLGARAIYLYQGKQDTHLRIHGTIAPQTIGTNSSNGCFRMINDHVIDLYSRVRMGTPVVIL
jgi:lipoprotein-anchoring transpeptidase ErfK/SrfK